MTSLRGSLSLADLIWDMRDDRSDLIPALCRSLALSKVSTAQAKSLA